MEYLWIFGYHALAQHWKCGWLEHHVSFIPSRAPTFGRHATPYVYSANALCFLLRMHVSVLQFLTIDLQANYVPGIIETCTKVFPPTLLSYYFTQFI